MKFQKGESGNRLGRPRRTDTEAALRQKIRDNLPGILDGLIAQAAQGDTAAAKVLLDRAMPALRPLDSPVKLQLSSELADSGRTVLAALGAGHLTPDQAGKILSGLGTLARVIEADELLKRVEALEEATRADSRA